MNTYYRMTTAQKEAVPKEQLDCEPYSNIVGNEWIVEAYERGYECITEYANADACIEYINNNIVLWDEWHNI